MNLTLRILLPAVLAGVVGGLVASLLQHSLTEPLLAHLLAEPARGQGVAAWARLAAREIPPAMFQAILLMGLWHWRRLRPDWGRSVLWGLAGFAVAMAARFVLLPELFGIPALPAAPAGTPAELLEALRWATLLCAFLSWIVLGLAAGRAWGATRLLDQGRGGDGP